MQSTLLRRSASVLVLLLVAIAVAAQEPATNASPSRPSPTSGPYSWAVGPFAYDPSGNVATIGGSYYIYDPMSRLVTSSVQRPDQMGSQVDTYGYDVYGNRTTVDGVATYAASTATNRLTGVGAVYDAAGNLTQWQPPGSAFARQYTYDSLDMITNEVAGGQLAVNIYTPDDERLWRFDVSHTVSHWTVRDLSGKVLRDFLDDPNDSNGLAWKLNREYIYRNGQLLAVNAPTGTEHYSLDHLGSPRLVTDGNRNRIFHHHYLPFGGEWTIGGESVDGSTLRFTGHERDDDPLNQPNGTLDYMHGRYYAANIARFLSVDPLVETRRAGSHPESWNRYAYTYNNPVSLIDPDGRQVRNPMDDVRTFLTLYKLIKVAINGARVRGPNISGNVVGGITAGGVKGWNYFSLSAGDALENRNILSITAQYEGLGVSTSIDFDSLDRSSLSVIGLIFQKTVFGDEPDQISIGFGKLIGGEVDTPIEPIAIDLVESLTMDDLSLIMDALEKNPELKQGFQFLDGVLVRIK